MKIIINGEGFLSIERSGTRREQWCPFRAMYLGGPCHCADDCPLFGEPEPVMAGGDLTPLRETDLSTLTICQGRVLAGEIIDERKEPGK